MKPGPKPTRLPIFFDGLPHYCCKVCQGVYPQESFYLRNTGLYSPYCKACECARGKKHREQFREPKIVLGSPDVEQYIALTLSDLGLL